MEKPSELSMLFQYHMNRCIILKPIFYINNKLKLICSVKKEEPIFLETQKSNEEWQPSIATRLFSIVSIDKVYLRDATIALQKSFSIQTALATPLSKCHLAYVSHTRKLLVSNGTNIRLSNLPVGLLRIRGPPRQLYPRRLRVCLFVSITPLPGTGHEENDRVAEATFALATIPSERAGEARLTLQAKE